MTEKDLATAEKTVLATGFQFSYEAGEKEYVVAVVNHDKRVVFKTSDIKELRQWACKRRAQTRRKNSKEAKAWVEKQWRTH